MKIQKRVLLVQDIFLIRVPQNFNRKGKLRNLIKIKFFFKILLFTKFLILEINRKKKGLREKLEFYKKFKFSGEKKNSFQN